MPADASATAPNASSIPRTRTYIQQSKASKAALARELLANLRGHNTFARVRRVTQQ